MAKSLLLNVFKGRVEVVNIINWKDIPKQLECDYFEIHTYKIGDEKRVFDIYCDECGALKPNVISVINSSYQTQLVNNILVTNHDENGDQIDLTDEEIEYIKEYIMTTKCSKKDPLYLFFGIKDYVFLTKCDF